MIVKRRTRGTNGIRPARLAEVSFRLHYAQTQRQSRCQIYTTITWDYTTLKLKSEYSAGVRGFTTTWDYTTLKLPVVRPRLLIVLLPLGITLLSSIESGIFSRRNVLLPLGITLLSNQRCARRMVHEVLLPLGITLLSNPTSCVM